MSGPQPSTGNETAMKTFLFLILGIFIAAAVALLPFFLLLFVGEAVLGAVNVGKGFKYLLLLIKSLRSRLRRRLLIKSNRYLKPLPTLTAPRTASPTKSSRKNGSSATAAAMKMPRIRKRNVFMAVSFPVEGCGPDISVRPAPQQNLGNLSQGTFIPRSQAPG